MNVLVANIGSTSFKYRLFDMTDETQLARGGIERIGSESSACFVQVGERRTESTSAVKDHGAAVQKCLDQLTDSEQGCLDDVAEVSAIGFKTVHGGDLVDPVRVDAQVLDTMEQFCSVAPAHNPPYLAAMRTMSERFAELPLVACFETGFHATMPARNRHYAVPMQWAEAHGVRRYGFHGASHRYIATRAAELLDRSDLRIVSCHLGGSSSLCAIRDGNSVATSMGMSPQSGIPHNNRIGDFDPYALPVLAKRTGKSFDELLDELANQSGLLGLSGISGDVRDLEAAAQAGNEKARLALDVFIGAVRHYLGAYLVELGGADTIVFTGGIGENSASTREQVCRDLGELGIQLDPEANGTANGECRIDAEGSRTQIWVMPTNEELIVARQTKQLLKGH